MGKVIVMQTPAEYSKALTAARELAARTGQPDPFRPGGVIPLGAKRGAEMSKEIAMTPEATRALSSGWAELGRALRAASAVATGKACWWEPPKRWDRDLLERRTTPLKRGWA